MRKAQSSLEYTLIIGMMILALTIAVAVALYYSSSAKGQIRANQMDKIGKKIVDTSNSIYYLGPPSKATIELEMPDGVRSITIEPDSSGNMNYIEFKFQGIGGDASGVYHTKANISNSGDYLSNERFLSRGVKRLTIQATTDENGQTEITLSHNYE